MFLSWFAARHPDYTQTSSTHPSIMVRVLVTGALACSTLAAPAFAADLADLPSCLKPRTLSAVTSTITQASVIKDPLLAQGFRTSDPACTYQVFRPVPQEVPIRGLW